MNYFASTAAAQRYAAGRPYFHVQVIGRIAEFLNLETKKFSRQSVSLARALDVGCGTGQSSVALEAIAQKIVGVDVSQPMLDLAPRDPRISYIRAAAEQLPFEKQVFDLITACKAIHWFDHGPFLNEAHRVLRPGGWLVVYQNGCFGKMLENPHYEQWNRQQYVPRYPTPPRNDQPLTDEIARAHGFEPRGTENYSHNITFTPPQLVAYLISQSNVTAAVERGRETCEEATKWLLVGVKSLFRGATGTFPFGGSIRWLQRD